MTALLAGSVQALTEQPPLLSLLNSTSTPSLSPLWSVHTDTSDPQTSFVHTIADIELRPKVARRKWDAAPDERMHVPHHQPVRGNIVDPVIHLQAKRARKTYIQIGDIKAATAKKRRRLSNGQAEGDTRVPLGAELPFVHLQLKRLGQRGLAFEVGVVDAKGREGVIRCSSSQPGLVKLIKEKEPSIHRYRFPPLLHLPLQLPEQAESSMTPWMDIAINAAQLLPLFQTIPNPDSSGSDNDQGSDSDSRRGAAVQHGTKAQRKVSQEMPNGQFASISFVRVYANCRIKRIWLSAEGDRTFDGLGSAARRDFALRAAASPDERNTP